MNESPMKPHEIQHWAWAITVAFAIAGIGFLLAEARRLDVIGSPWISTDMTNHLGAEYDNVAQAIHEGRGFSDPFGRGDGPTAWMPPLLPAILASLYFLADGSREVVVMFARLFQGLAVAFFLCLVLQPFHRFPHRRVIAGVALIAVLTHFRYLFQLTHDHTLLMVLVSGMWWSFSQAWDVRWDQQRSRKRTAVLSGIGGGVLALASPVIGGVWAIQTAVLWKQRPALIAVAAAVSIAVVTPWIVRNRMVMGHWIPIKSNAAYEFWQALVVDDDGVVDVSLGATHPYNAGGQDGITYTEEGEMIFLAEKQVVWKAVAMADPSKFIDKIVNRITAAFLNPVPYSHWDTTRTLAWTSKRIWVMVCSLSLLVILWLHPVPLTPRIRLAIAIWFLTLTPYLLCSYYERYDMIIFPMRLFVVLTACSLFLDRTPRFGNGVTGNPPMR